MKALTYILFGVGAAPLLIYPFILMGNLMTLGGHRATEELDLQVIIIYSYIIASTIYPLVYAVCTFVSARYLIKDKNKKALI